MSARLRSEVAGENGLRHPQTPERMHLGAFLRILLGFSPHPSTARWRRQDADTGSMSAHAPSAHPCVPPAVNTESWPAPPWPARGRFAVRHGCDPAGWSPRRPSRARGVRDAARDRALELLPACGETGRSAVASAIRQRARFDGAATASSPRQLSTAVVRWERSRRDHGRRVGPAQSPFGSTVRVCGVGCSSLNEATGS